MNEEEIKNLFIKSFDENIDNAMKSVSKLEENVKNHQELENLHRFFHSLKSESLAMGYNDQGLRAKEYEDLLYEILHTTKTLDVSLLKKMKATLEDYRTFLTTLKTQFIA